MNKKLNSNFIIWFTGLSGSGKTTLANELNKELIRRFKKNIILDGDEFRKTISYDLGFSDKDRTENIRRVLEVSKLFFNTNHIVICSFISPIKKDREKVRDFYKKEFIEIYLDCPFEICENRDVKGLYKKVKDNKIKKFTGKDSIYEKPDNPELIIDTNQLSINESLKKIINYLEKNSFFN